MNTVIMDHAAFLDMLDRILKELSDSNSTALRGAINPIYDSLLDAVTADPPASGEYLGLCGLVSSIPAIVQAFAAVSFSSTNMGFVTNDGFRALSSDERHAIGIACAIAMQIAKLQVKGAEEANYKVLNDATMTAHFARKKGGLST